MPSTQRGCRCSCETYVAAKNVTRRPILFSQLRRRGGEGTVNPEELFADDRPLRLEEDRERENELRAGVEHHRLGYILLERDQPGVHPRCLLRGVSVNIVLCSIKTIFQ